MAFDVVSCDCDPAPGACLERAELLAENGTALDSAVVSNGFAVLDYPTNESAPFTLRLRGCGAVATVPLPVPSSHTPPVIRRVTYADRMAYLDWSYTGTPSAVWATCSDSVGESRCRDALDDRVELARHGLYTCNLSVAELVEFPPVATELGTISIVSGLESAPGPLAFFPAELGDASFALPGLIPSGHTGVATLRLTVDGTTTEGGATVSSASAALLSSNTDETIWISVRLDESQDRIIYEAGATQDRIEYYSGGTELFEATIPHVLPTDGLEAGDYQSENYILNIGPTVFTSAGGAGSVQLSFTLNWDLGVLLAQPL